MNKKDRDIVFNKYGGKCAYTGKVLGIDWQVDHVTPKFHFDYMMLQGDCNSIENLVPAIKIINHYKRAKDLEGFRKYMMSFHIRISKLPKKTIVASTTKRKAYMLMVAKLFGIAPEKPFTGVFYFETLK